MVVIPADGEAASVSLRVRAAPGIDGRVVFHLGRPVGDIAVYCIPFGNGGEFLPRAELRRHGASETRVRADGGFAFSFHDLEPGRYRIGVALGRGPVSAHRDVEVDSSLVEAVVDVSEPATARFIPLQVLAANGEPVSDAEIHSLHQSEERTRGGAVFVFRLGGGRYLVQRPAVDYQCPGGIDDGGRGRVFASHPGHGVVGTDFAASTRSLLLRFAVRHRVRIGVRLADSNGRRGGLCVRAVSAADGNIPETLARDAWQPFPDDGEVTLSLPEGDNLVSLATRTNASSPFLIGQRTIRVGSTGCPPVTFDVPELHEIVALIPEPRSEVSIRAADGGYPAVFRVPSPSTRITIRGIPNGAYVIAAHGYRTEVALSGPGEVSLRGKRE
jgi:hypothetical protein